MTERSPHSAWHRVKRRWPFLVLVTASAMIFGAACTFPDVTFGAGDTGAAALDATTDAGGDGEGTDA